MHVDDMALTFAEISADAHVQAGDDAKDVGWFTEAEIEAASFGKV